MAETGYLSRYLIPSLSNLTPTQPCNAIIRKVWLLPRRMDATLILFRLTKIQSLVPQENISQNFIKNDAQIVDIPGFGSFYCRGEISGLISSTVPTFYLRPDGKHPVYFDKNKTKNKQNKNTKKNKQTNKQTKKTKTKTKRKTNKQTKIHLLDYLTTAKYLRGHNWVHFFLLFLLLPKHLYSAPRRTERFTKEKE